MSTPRPTEWTVDVTHPDTGRILAPEVLDDPQITPSLNRLPEIQVPVRRSDTWIGIGAAADMSVYRDGDEQPIDELTDASDERDKVVLEGVGGTELRERIEREYVSERRHLAAEEIIQNATGYVADVDEPTGALLEDEQVQNPSTSGDFGGVSSFADDLPVKIVNGEVRGAQTAFVREGPTRNRDNNLSFTTNDDDASDGTAIGIGASNSNAEWDFAPRDHTIPADRVGVYIRSRGSNDLQECEVVLSVNGSENQLDFFNGGEGLTRTWNDYANSPFNGSGYTGGDIQPGDDVTLKVRGTGTNGGTFWQDVVALVDTAYTPAATNVDNTVHEPQGYLDGPAEFPTVNATFDDHETPFSIVAGRVTSTFNDTSGAQRVQLSNDRGETYLPSDGTETNTTSVDVDFPDPGPALRLRVTLDGYEPDGPQNATPRLGYASQAISTYDLRADIRQESLLIDERFDDTIEEILTQIAGDEFVWSYRVVDGTPTVTFTQPGQRVADRDPDLGDVTTSTRLDTFRSVTIKGSNQSASNQQFDASTTFVTLPRDDILEGSETVYDAATGENFERDTDYVIRYGDGEIRIREGGSMTAGETYRIDYRYAISGTHTVDAVDASRPEFVETVAGVTSTRQAEQIAFVLAEVDPGVATPRYEATLSIPRSEVPFDPIEALTLKNLELPAEARPLAIRDDPEVTPRGLELRLGSGEPLRDALSAVSRQLSRVSRRS